jgi:hypothetical protein
MRIAVPLGKSPAIIGMQHLIIVEGTSAYIPEAHHKGDNEEQAV